MKKLRKAITVLSLAFALTPAMSYILPSLETVSVSAASTNVNGNKPANTEVGKESGISKDTFANLLTENPVLTPNEGRPVLHLTEVKRPDKINLYKQKSYNVFDVFYNSNYTRGIFTMGQTTAGNPISYDAAKLSVSKTKGDKVYSWIRGSWKLQTSYPKDEYALRVLTWSDGKWNKKVYRYTDSTKATNPLKSSEPLEIKRDFAGNWYLLIRNNDKNYIYQLDEHLRVKYKVCVSDLIDSQLSNFYILTNGKVLIETYDSADTTTNEASWNEAARLYKNLQLIDLKSGKITKEYDTGYNPSGYVKVDGKFIYMRDKSKENIVIIDSGSGKIVKIIDLSEYDDLIKPFDYSEELGTQYDYDYTISGKYLYLLKKTGVYRIDLGNGKFRKLMDNSYKPFGIQDMRFLDFKVKNADTFYILAVNFDSECATHFYTYTK